MYYKTSEPRQGRCKPIHYVIDTPESALSHRVRNEKSRADDPTCMARKLARISWWNHSHGEWNCRERGGVSDHVHLLIGLRATHRLADVLRELKAVSSGWVHDEIGIHRFAWQEGYGTFTVSASQRQAVRQYIEQQPEHHRTRTFREEYLELLRRSGVEFDERYV
jgi:hypothetical protein